MTETESGGWAAPDDPQDEQDGQGGQVTPHEPQEGAEDDAQGEAPTAGRDPASKARNEARNLRARLKAAEAEREQLLEAAGQMRRDEIIRQAQAPGGLRDGNDLLIGTAVEDLLTDTGTVDPAKVQAAVEKTLADHPGWGTAGRSQSMPVSKMRSFTGHPEQGKSWHDLLAGR